MESQGASGKPWVPKLSLENYLNLEHLKVISSFILRKIIMMHGFKSFKVPKDKLMDAVRSIDLMDAHHSTLQIDVSSNAFLSVNDVIKDLSVLHWQECCITSTETINFMTEFGAGVDESSPKCFKSDCNTASSSEEDSVGNKTQILAFKITKGIRSARRPNPNISKAFSWKEYVENLEAKSQALKIIKGNTSAKRLKPNLHTTLSSKKDSESHKTQSQALMKSNLSSTKSNTLFIRNISAKDLMANFNMASSFKEHSETYETQSQALMDITNVAIQGNTLPANNGEQVDQTYRPRRDIKKPIWMNQFVSPKI